MFCNILPIKLFLLITIEGSKTFSGKQKQKHFHLPCVHLLETYVNTVDDVHLEGFVVRVFTEVLKRETARLHSFM